MFFNSTISIFHRPLFCLYFESEIYLWFDRLFIYIQKMPRAEDKLQTIQELYNYPENTNKACTVGFVIDATNAYFDEKKIKYVKKIKLIDDHFNSSHFNPHQKFSYMTVFFYAPSIEDLPNPRFIGDIIYLRRYFLDDQDFPLELIMAISKATSLKHNIVPGLWSTETPKLTTLNNIKLRNPTWA